MGVSTSPAQSRPRRSTPSQRVVDLPASHQDSKDGQHTKIQFGSVKNKAQGTTPWSHTVSRANFSTNTHKGVLRTKDLINKYLDGLEVFSNVYGVSLNSSNFQMAV